jgi:hypothetical protein
MSTTSTTSVHRNYAVLDVVNDIPNLAALNFQIVVDKSTCDEVPYRITLMGEILNRTNGDVQGSRTAVALTPDEFCQFLNMLAEFAILNNINPTVS